mgnify:CR=1 FL=1
MVTGVQTCALPISGDALITITAVAKGDRVNPGEVLVEIEG